MFTLEGMGQGIYLVTYNNQVVDYFGTVEAAAQAIQDIKEYMVYESQQDEHVLLDDEYDGLTPEGLE